MKALIPTVKNIVSEVTDDVCLNFCKYRGTATDNSVCEYVEEGNECPLDRLNSW